MKVLAAYLLLLAASATADCPPGSFYDSSFNKCYKFISTPMYFSDAEQYCTLLGGHLAEVSNSFENSYISSIARGTGSQAPNFWIGANSLRSSSWTWTSGAPWTYANWASGQPNNAFSCAYVWNYTGAAWVALDCNTQLQFMCTIAPFTPSPTPKPTPTPTSAPYICPSHPYCSNGYTFYSGNCMCYKYYSDYQSFNQANASCTRDSGMLAKVPSKDVNDFLTALPGRQTMGSQIPYIGLYCGSTTANSCSWVDGTHLGNYTNFYNDIRQNAYVLMSVVSPRNSEDGKWENVSPNSSRSFLCQKAAIPSFSGSEKKEIDTYEILKKKMRLI